MYYITFVIGAILTLINDKKGICLKAFTVLLAALAVCRYGVGADYFAYNYLYTRLDHTLFYEYLHGTDNQEILFRLIGAFFKKLGFSYQLYLCIIAAVGFLYLYKTCKKFSYYPIFSMFAYYCFYYFVWTFSGLRQGLTLIIGIYYLLECLENNKTLKLILITALLMLIHSSAIILIPLYFAARIKFNRNSLVLISLFCIGLSFIPLGSIFARFSWIPFVDRILPYLASSTSVTALLDFKSFGRIIFLVIGLAYYKIYTENDHISRKYMNVYILGIIIYFCLKFSELVAARMSLYGIYLSIIILPNIYYLYKDKINNIIFLLCLSSLCTLYFCKELRTLEDQTGLQNPYRYIVPYTSVFNKNAYEFDNGYKDSIIIDTYNLKED